MTVIGIGIVVNSSGQVLISQRLEDTEMPGMWEFPGGKKEEGEAIELTIQREIREETSMDVVVGKRLIDFIYDYPPKQFHFIVHICNVVSGQPKPLASQKICWVMPSKLIDYSFPEANSRIISALNKYLKLKKKPMDD